TCRRLPKPQPFSFSSQPPAPAFWSSYLLLEKAGLALAVGHMFTSCRVGILIQIPAGRFLAALRQGVYVGQRRPGLIIASGLGVACDQGEETVGVRLDAAS